MQTKQLNLTSSEIEASLEAINKFMQKFNRVMSKSNHNKPPITYDTLQTETDEMQQNIDQHTLTRADKINQIHKIKNKLSTVEQQSILITQKESLSPISKYQNDEKYFGINYQSDKVFIIDDLNQHILLTAKNDRDSLNCRQNSNSKSRPRNQSMKKILSLKNSMKQHTENETIQKPVIVSPFNKELEDQKKNYKKIVKIKARVKKDKFTNQNSHELMINRVQKIQKMYTQQTNDYKKQENADNFKNKTLKKPTKNGSKGRAILKECISRRKVNLIDFNNNSERKKGLQIVKSPYLYGSVDENRSKEISMEKIKDKFNQYKKQRQNEKQLARFKKPQIHINVIETISNKISRNSSQQFQKAPLKIVRENNKVQKKLNHRISETVCRSIIINR